MKTSKRLVFGLVVLGLLVSTVVLYTQPQPDQTAGEHMLDQVYHTILNRYVAEIDPEKLSEAGIKGMLHALDPYSQHINDQNSYRLDAITTGEYGGVGIRLGWMNDSLIVISPMDGTPAFRQGILAGDRIVKIDSVWTRQLDLDEAAHLVRGGPGSTLRMLIKREGEPELLTFDFQRELIKVPDVSYSGLMADRTGYVKLSNFSKYSAEDLERAVRKLNATQLKALIIDLRGNPGGLLSAALMSADLFIGRGLPLLETRGRVKQANKTFITRRKPIVDSSLPLVVLVNGGSASASEILAGILQDYDRAVIVGEPSYGKGLVQTVTRLTPESRLKLTTAKYYLPSGRLIQKREIAHDVLYEDLQPGSDSTFFSANHRHLQGGGGVTPDVTVAPLHLSSFERKLWQKRLFFKYALDYTGRHPGLTLPLSFEPAQADSFFLWLDRQGLFPETELQKWRERGVELVDSSSVIHGDIMALQSSLVALDSLYRQEEIQQNQVQILNGIELEVAAIVGGNGARVAASLRYDPVIQQAIALGSDGTALAKLLADRSSVSRSIH